MKCPLIGHFGNGLTTVPAKSRVGLALVCQQLPFEAHVICPYCGIGTSPTFQNKDLGGTRSRQFTAGAGNCTECDELIVVARGFERDSPYPTVSDDFLIYRPAAARVQRRLKFPISTR